MTTETASLALNKSDLGHLRYLRGLALQPAEEWAGFYLTPSDGMNFGLRFQVAFAGYALYALARRTPAYRAPYVEALLALTERMISPPTWAYWFRGATRALPMAGEPVQPPGGLGRAVEGLHSRLGLGGSIPPDPCQEGNIQFSAHLASLLGFYELLTGDDRYDRAGLDLRASANGQPFEFHYTHTSLVERIQAQMEHSHFGGACCEPGRAYAACNNHACISNILHDRLHGTNFASVNGRWAEWVRTRMLTGGVGGGGLPLPAPNGLLSVAYMPDLHLPIPVSFNLTDAWGLAFMAAWEPDTVKEVYPRLRRRLKAGPEGSLYLGSVGPNERAEISTVGLNTAFAAVLAREMGDVETFRRLLAWADATLAPSDYPATGRFYEAAKPAPYVTALFALAQALPEAGGGLHALLNWRPDFATPYLASVSPAVEVSEAEWHAPHLSLGFKAGPSQPLTLRIENCPRPTSLNFAGIEIEPDSDLVQYDLGTQTLLLHLTLPDSTESRLVLS